MKILSINIDKTDYLFEEYIKKGFKHSNKEMFSLPYYECSKEAYKKQFVSVGNEMRSDLTEKAEEDAIKTFQDNLKKLLLIKPSYNKKVLAIDPGFRTGCKIALLNEKSEPVAFSKINILEDKEKAIEIIKQLITTHTPDVIVLGNGTASNETYDLLKDTVNIPIIVVNENGASVYSASEVAQEEFPKLDVIDRGTISIGRRYIDPLAELVKIPPQSIGVGMYQHDVNQKKLAEKLGFVVEDIVNLIGINLNTASVYVLKYISGLNKTSAKKIFSKKPYTSREDLKKILSKKAFEQSAGFLRVPESEEKLDNTNIHPEHYALAKYVLEKKVTMLNYLDHYAACKELYADVSLHLIKDMQEAFTNASKEHRVFSGNLKVDANVTMGDLKEDQIVKGIVRNIMPFGAFVDIGVKNNGLLHISQMAEKFVRNPSEIVSIGEEIKVRVVSVDKETGKIQLSLKEK